MARGPFPSGDFGRNTSDRLIGTGVGAPGSEGASAIAGAASEFGRRLRGVADRAYVREGEADAAAVIRASTETGIEPAIRQRGGIDDQAYNAIVREKRGTDRQAAYLEDVSALEAQHGENLGAFSEALAATRKGYLDRPTGDVQLDTGFANFITLQDGAAARRVRVGEERRRVATARGVLTTAVATGQTALGQAIASAGLDDSGAQLVGASLNQFAGTLARFGPREAFSVGGIDFPADPTRSAAADPDDLARLFDAAQAQARMSWIVNAGDQAPGAMAKLAFVGQVRDRWASGDAMFAGLDVGQMDQVVGRLEAGASRAAADEQAEISQAGSQARDLLKALDYGGDVDLDQIRALAEQSGDPSLIAETEYRLTYGFDVTPGQLRENLAGSGTEGILSYDASLDFILNDLEGSGEVADDNGRGRAKYGLTERNYPALFANGNWPTLAQARRAIREDYGRLVGVETMSPEMAMVVTSTAYNGGPDTARRILEESGGDPERFLLLEERRFRRLAADNPAKYGDDLPGWLNRQGRTRARLGQMRAQRRAADGYATDPIGYARGTGNRAPLATVAEFDPGSVFAGREGVREWGDALRARRATGQELSRRDGVPARMLSSEEVTYYKDRIESDPAAVVTLAAAAGSGLGGDGARAFFGELGRSGLAGADLHLATLATEPTNANIVRDVVDGRTLRAGGARDADFGDEDSIAKIAPTIAPALGAQPDLLSAVTSIAQDMAIADAARGRLKSATAYLNSAMGATMRDGQRYGGVITFNGAPTLAPNWLRADRMDDALEIAARGWAASERGPVYQDGRTIPAQQLMGYRMTAMPNGRYRLIHPRTGDAAAARSGRAFEFDIENEGFRDLLKRRLPDAVLSGVR